MNDESKQESEYLKAFPTDGGIRKAALDRAWKNRDFEINLFWKRAAYFWVFIALSYAGLFKVLPLTSSFLLKLALSLICITLSFIWILVQLGSKRWQENWESHIDMLEDQIEGPIYKYVTKTKFSFSVSRLNLWVSGINFLFSLSLLGYALNKAGNVSICGQVFTFLGLAFLLLLIGIFSRTSKTSKTTEFKLRENSLLS